MTRIDSTVYPDNKRAEKRDKPDQFCSAIIRIGGIPVYQVELKDISENGTCFIVRDESTILRHLRVGEQIDIQFHNQDGNGINAFHRSKIIYITGENRGRYKGHRLVGVQILERLSLSLNK